AAVRTVEWRADGEVRLAGSGSATASVGQLDASADPLPSLAALRERLAPGEPVVFIQADIRHAGAAVGSADWEQLVGQRNAYLDTPTALTVLYRAGFRCQGVRRLRRRVTLEELVTNPAGDLVVPAWRRRLLRLLPAPLRRAWRADVPVAEVAILATRRPPDAPAVSVVVPVYNEAAYVAQLLDAVLRVEIRDASIEVVIVESNSTDGSREIVQRYAAHPRVTCLFEDRPRGKGHATRFGLARARGDILLIQDADLEYDIEDYHSLIEPILHGHEALVLGSRHGGRKHWKLRQFGKPLLTKFYNLAHVLVTAYINLLFGLRLRDPQTMYKVCRRDCVEGIAFHGNHFDFDYELLLKVVRKGYQPAEVPVNYRSRSHAEGKKLYMLRDAPLGLWMITKLRFTPLRRFLTIGEPFE
ncbi:MAG TPA: glycosyltransferase family 2 protein, partial [Opitutaceae bacterium]|nr:glycosyltransferase family 2 protein [Opitutaceae bacterium]